MRHFRKTLSTLCLVLTILPVPSLSFNYINIVYVGSDSVNGWSPTSTCQAFEGGNDNATCTDSRQTCQGAGCERGVDNVTCTDSRPTCQACGVDNARTCPDSRPWCTCGGMEQDVNDSLCYELEEVPATENLFEYCACRLGDLGYDVVLRDPSDSMVMSSCCGNSVQLAEVESRIAYGLRNFSNLLSRTIVGVYVRSYRERRQCWDAYVQWLCSTQLPLFMPVTDGDVSECTANCTDEFASNCTDECSGSNITRARPSLRVCHNVLQRCPYYIPSEYQQSMKPGDGGTRQIIYGGFPAFDCPREDLFKRIPSCPVSGKKCTTSTPSYCRCGDSCPYCISICRGTLQTSSKSLTFFVTALLCLGLLLRTF